MEHNPPQLSHRPIVLVHNFYQQPGGEDMVFTAEAELLESHGHRVVRYTVHNDTLGESAGMGVAARAIWNPAVHRALVELVRREQPEVVHFHNTFPQVSPAAYYAAAATGAGIVQTLHNFRVTCVNGLLYRNGKPCEDCVGARVPWKGVARACYRNSRTASAVTALSVATHRAIGTWRSRVDRYIALSDFAAKRFVRAGIPADRIIVKPQFTNGGCAPQRPREGFALYVGRLSEEKGIAPLLRAGELFAGKVPLTVVGDGPMREQVLAACGASDGRIQWLGRRDAESVRDLMERAACLVLPSTCYEGFPRVVVEAFAAALPVVASKIGGLSELVRPDETGDLAAPGDPDDLARAIMRMNSPVAKARVLGQNARREYEQRYSPAANYEQLRSIYAAANADSGS